MSNQYNEDYQISNWGGPDDCFMTQWGRISYAAWLKLEQRRIAKKGIASQICQRKACAKEEYALFRKNKLDRRKKT